LTLLFFNAGHFKAHQRHTTRPIKRQRLSTVPAKNERLAMHSTETKQTNST